MRIIAMILMSFSALGADFSTFTPPTHYSMPHYRTLSDIRQLIGEGFYANDPFYDLICELKDGDFILDAGCGLSLASLEILHLLENNPEELAKLLPCKKPQPKPERIFVVGIDIIDHWQHYQDHPEEPEAPLLRAQGIFNLKLNSEVFSKITELRSQKRFQLKNGPVQEILTQLLPKNYRFKVIFDIYGAFYYSPKDRPQLIKLYYDALAPQGRARMVLSTKDTKLPTTLSYCRQLIDKYPGVFNLFVTHKGKLYFEIYKSLDPFAAFF